MKRLLTLICLSFTLGAYAQVDVDSATIRGILDRQTQAWNRGDKEAFMHGYWESDSLMFIGKNGVTYGYNKTLNNYRRNYPDTAAMGKLTFHIMEVKRLSDNHYFVLGKWMLQRSIGNLNGHYTLLFRKINGEWVIVADHSS